MRIVGDILEENHGRFKFRVDERTKIELCGEACVSMRMLSNGVLQNADFGILLPKMGEIRADRSHAQQDQDCCHGKRFYGRSLRTGGWD